MDMHHQLLIILHRLWCITVSLFTTVLHSLCIISLPFHISTTMLDTAIMIEVGVTKAVSIMVGVMAAVIEAIGIAEDTMRGAMAVTTSFNALIVTV
jgi:hypothetical protein